MRDYHTPLRRDKLLKASDEVKLPNNNSMEMKLSSKMQRSRPADSQQLKDNPDEEEKMSKSEQAIVERLASKKSHKADRNANMNQEQW